MSWWSRLWNSSIGMKTVMALTGMGLLLFVIAHLLGNLQFFLGADALNSYAKKLQSLSAILWGMRIGLLAIFGIHVLSAARLTLLNRAARPTSYSVQKPVQVGIAPRTLLLTGSLILVFIVYHLLHFTIGVTDPDHFHLKDAGGRYDVYAMVIHGFSQPAVSISYIVAMLLLGTHLSHGIPSLFQSLGWNYPKYEPFLNRAGAILAWLIVAGNVSIPLSVMLELVKLPGKVA